MVIENCEQAKNDATIAAFVKLFETDAVDGVLDFRTLQEPRYMPFGNRSVSRSVLTEII